MSEVRVCENCNYHNSINNLECEKCGFDLSFVIPIEENELQKQEEIVIPVDAEAILLNSPMCCLKLVSLDKQVVIPITDELVIGRDGVNGSYFEKSTYVSRKHAIFYVENGKTMISDVSTNGTFVNEKRLPKGTKITIHSSDKIVFADLTFEVENAD